MHIPSNKPTPKNPRSYNTARGTYENGRYVVREDTPRAYVAEQFRTTSPARYTSRRAV